MNKLTAIFSNGSGWALVLTFIYFGLKSIQTHFTGSVSSDIGVIIAILGMILHPTEMVGGKSISRT